MATTTRGYPYPVGTDLVNDGDNVLHSLADALDLKAGIGANGTVSIPTTVAGTPASVSVTFPAGRFTVAPVVMVTQQGQNPHLFSVGIQPPTATGVVVWANRSSGSGNTTVYWSALYAP